MSFDDVEFHYLAKKNAHARDSRIHMTAEHVYVIDGDATKKYVSATTLAEGDGKPFNRRAIAIQCSRTRDVNSPYYGLSPDGVERYWEHLAKQGRTLHRYIEKYYEYKTAVRDGLTPPEDHDVLDESMREWRYFCEFDKKFIDANDYVAYRVEWQLFDEDAFVSGTPDAIFFNARTNDYTLVDWKRVQINMNDDAKLHDRKKFAKFTNQLNIYAEMLARKYDIFVRDMFIVVFHSENNAYECKRVAVNDDTGPLFFGGTASVYAPTRAPVDVVQENDDNEKKDDLVLTNV